ncbi:sensor histidine kinase [Symbioplanes lichenis]|uniref:sensor histidine kinase n=1 Tax=Symbioplanes lichenis TaxID=1629072 RepID=UPI0027399891|nr:histidine kinase [Actinoplanes lichenis]
MRTRWLLAADVAGAVALAGAGIAAVMVAGRPNEAPTPIALLTTILAALLLAGRRFAPVPALGTGVVVAAGCLLAGWVPGLLVFVIPFLLYLVAATAADRRTGWTYAGVCTVVLYACALIGLEGGWLHPPMLLIAAWTAMSGGFGDAARSRRAYIAAVEERARRAEQTREEEAERRVIQERLRIARELHDVVAHHIAVINMQAGGATRVLERRPDQARTALAYIGKACDTVLKELASVVGVLRQSDDPDAATEPTPGLVRLPQLLDDVRAAGLRVDYAASGTPRELPAVVDLAAYRIVQEGLTNAHKYGTGHAALVVGWTPSVLSVDVRNEIAPGRPSGAGNGLVGMRERAAAADGTLTADADGDTFVVHADLPLGDV